MAFSNLLRPLLLGASCALAAPLVAADASAPHPTREQVIAEVMRPLRRPS